MRMIGVDWGTTNMRAYRLRAGAVLESIEGGPGLLSVTPGGFAVALRDVIGPWLQQGEHQVLLAGMVGSRQGWVEAPYLPCPADPAALAGAAVAVPFEGAQVRLLPGLSSHEGAVPEVMRGEEVQIAGVLSHTGPDALVCLPGTHSKWARIAGGRVTGFRTHMTGETFAALRDHTILGRLMEDAPHVPAAFLRGVDRAAEPGGLLHHLFGVRTQGLFALLPANQAASYLSGLLIGHEVMNEANSGLVHLVGTPTLCGLYQAALGHRGVQSRVATPDAAAAGLAAIGEHVTWG